MNSLVVKAICRRIEARYGSNRAAAMAAGVSGGVWSNYCSDEQPDTTIPFHRLLLIANAAERKAFADILLGDDATAALDVLTEASETTETAAELQATVRRAVADGKLSILEKRDIRAKALEVQANAAEVLASLEGGAA